MEIQLKTNPHPTIKIFEKMTKMLRLYNNIYLMALLLILNFSLISAVDMSYDEVQRELDKVNSQPGNIDEINMPTKCESCIIFARDFETEAMKIPLKLVNF